MIMFNSLVIALIFSVSFLAVLPQAEAQEIPYGVSDKEKLIMLLQDAKAHLSSNESDLKWLKAAGIASHQLANTKVKGASDDAVNYLKHATELEPDNTEILAYLGSAYAMAGRDSTFVVNKLSYVNKGLAALDKAVKKTPSNLNVRFIRGSVSYSVPAMFSRKVTAESDYRFYVNEVKTGAQADRNRLAEAYFKLGQIAEEKSQKTESLDFYTQAQKASPESDWAQQAAKAMR